MFSTDKHRFCNLLAHLKSEQAAIKDDQISNLLHVRCTIRTGVFKTNKHKLVYLLRTKQSKLRLKTVPLSPPVR